jgi:hypothetical protein
MSESECGEHEFHYYSAINEDGWKCTDCGHRPGEPPGFSPELDRKLIWMKVGAILWDACAERLISVSNGSGADVLTSVVADRCVKEGRFDQYSILLYILEEETPEHAEYWKEISAGVLSGADPRDRCHCGKLATMRIGKVGHYCSDACAPTEQQIWALFETAPA